MAQGGGGALAWVHFSPGLPDWSPLARRGTSPCMMLECRVWMTRSQTYTFACLWKDLFCICSLKYF